MKKAPATKALSMGRPRFVRNYIVDRLLTRIALGVRKKGYPPIAAIPSDAIGQSITAHGLFEEELLLALFDHLFEADHGQFRRSLALDVGANIGNHACFFARYFEHVLAFEPNPPVFKLLEANLVLSGADNVTAFAVGLSDRDDLLDFVEDRSGNLGGSAFSEKGDGDQALSEAPSHRRKLPVVRGDDFIVSTRGERAIALVKVDVEGHELRVLRGLAGVLAQHSPLVLFEAISPKSPGGGDEVMTFLRSVGYVAFYTAERKWRVSERIRKIPKVRGLVGLLLGLWHGADYFVFDVSSLDDREYPMLIASKRKLVGTLMRGNGRRAKSA